MTSVLGAPWRDVTVHEPLFTAADLERADAAAALVRTGVTSGGTVVADMAGVRHRSRGLTHRGDGRVVLDLVDVIHVGRDLEIRRRRRVAVTGKAAVGVSPEVLSGMRWVRVQAAGGVAVVLGVRIEPEGVFLDRGSVPHLEVVIHGEMSVPTCRLVSETFRRRVLILVQVVILGCLVYTALKRFAAKGQKSKAKGQNTVFHSKLIIRKNGTAYHGCLQVCGHFYRFYC